MLVVPDCSSDGMLVLPGSGDGLEFQGGSTDFQRFDEGTQAPDS